MIMASAASEILVREAELLELAENLDLDYE